MGKEEWRQVVGHEGTYSVSSNGRIRSEKSSCRGRWKAGRILAVSENNRNRPTMSYYKIRLGGGACRYVHHIVAEAFIGRRQKDLEVNHKDGNKFNNTASNLEYVTRKENVRHAIDVLGRDYADRSHANHVRGEQHYNHKLTPDDVRAIRILASSGMTQTAIARRFDIGQGTVHKITARKAWSWLN